MNEIEWLDKIKRNFSNQISFEEMMLWLEEHADNRTFNEVQETIGDNIDTLTREEIETGIRNIYERAIASHNR